MRLECDRNKSLSFWLAEGIDVMFLWQIPESKRLTAWCHRNRRSFTDYIQVIIKKVSASFNKVLTPVSSTCHRIMLLISDIKN